MANLQVKYDELLATHKETCKEVVLKLPDSMLLLVVNFFYVIHKCVGQLVHTSTNLTKQPTDFTTLLVFFFFFL